VETQWELLTEDYVKKGVEQNMNTNVYITKKLVQQYRLFFLKKYDH